MLQDKSGVGRGFIHSTNMYKHLVSARSYASPGDTAVNKMTKSPPPRISH